MNGRLTVRRAVGAAALALAPASLAAQGLRIEALTGQAGLSFDGTRSSTAQTPGSRVTLFAEWLDLSVSGFVADPRVLSLSALVRPTWRQVSGRQGSLEPATSSDAARVTDYALTATAFSGSPASGSTWLARSSGRRPGLFGSSFAFDVTRVGADVRLRNPPLPVSFDIQRAVRRDSLFRSDVGILTRADVLTEAGVRARNSKLYAALRYQSYDNRAGRTDQRTWFGDLDHRITWGKGSVLTSALQTINRSGFMALGQVRWDERLRLRHTRALASDWQYSQFSSDAAGLRSHGRTVAGAVTASLPSDLQAGLDGRAIWNRFPTGTRREVRAVPRLVLSRRTLGDATVRLHAAVGYEWMRQETADGAIAVFDEQHVMDASGRFSLSQPFVDTTTIVVTDVNQVIVYQSGADYRVLVTGQITEILLLPLSRIATSDTLLVDYRYHVGPSGRAVGVISAYGASVGWRPLQLYVSRDRRAPRSVRGRPLFLDYDYVTAGISATGPLGWLSVTARAEYQRREDGAIRVDARRLSATLSTALARSLIGSLGAAWNRQRGDQRLDDARADLSFRWAASGSLRLAVRGTVWSLQQRHVRREDFFGGGADLEWRVGQIEARVAYSRGWWQNGSDNVQDLVSVGIVRTF